MIVFVFCRIAERSSLILGFSRALNQQFCVYYDAQAHSFIDLPSSLDIILVHFIPIIPSNQNLYEALPDIFSFPAPY
jgi:hypothetical protein